MTEIQMAHGLLLTKVYRVYNMPHTQALPMEKIVLNSLAKFVFKFLTNEENMNFHILSNERLEQLIWSFCLFIDDNTTTYGTCCGRRDTCL